MDSLPPIFQANIPGTCTTGNSGELLNIPNPGKFGIVYAEPSQTGNGECLAADPPSFVKSPQGSGGNTASVAATLTSVPQSSPSSFVTVTTSSHVVTSDQPKYSNSTLSPTGTAASEAASMTGQPLWAAGLTRCPAADGTIYCYENNTFGLCNKGWADPRPLNVNQVCSNGEITYKYSSNA